MTDRIVSHPASQEYRDNFERIYGKRVRRDVSMPSSLLDCASQQDIEQFITSQSQVIDHNIL